MNLKQTQQLQLQVMQYNLPEIGYLSE